MNTISNLYVVILLFTPVIIIVFRIFFQLKGVLTVNRAWVTSSVITFIQSLILCRAIYINNSMSILTNAIVLFIWYTVMIIEVDEKMKSKCGD